MKTSIIEFSVENFNIFKNKVVFSMVSRKNEHTFESSGENLLKTTLIYGPNASGKSTLLNALRIFKNEIVGSTNNPDGVNSTYHPFLLSDYKDKPSFYEIIFSLDKRIFRYNFSVLKGEVVTENLFENLALEKEKNYLIRKGQNIKLFSDFKKSEDVKIKTRKEVLFLSAAAQWNNELAITILRMFKDINIISGPDSIDYRGYTIKLFKEDAEKKKQILDFLRSADFCIDDGFLEKMVLPDIVRKGMAENFKNIPSEVDTIFFAHSKFDAKNIKIGVEKINMGDESNGTVKFFDVLGPIIDTLENGKALFIDEFDNSLHPFLTKFIVDLFEKKNPKNAQLIATTHDTSLLSSPDFIKDQFWFTEKDKFGAGNIFSLAEFSLRNDTEYAKKYLEGRFGALPFIKSL